MSTKILHGDCLSVLPTLPEQSVDLVFGSPPYCDARTYDDGTLPDGHSVSRNCDDWVAWMLDVTEAALRVSKGAVVWVAAGVTRQRNYWPACEGLMWEWHKRGGHAYRPCYWHRYGIPGSGGDQWFRANIEYVMCFKREGKLPWTNNTAMGHKPLHGPGGPPSYRKKNGYRRTQRQSDGKLVPRIYNEPEDANPGNVISTGAAGGGNIGDKIAHENEAPFPEDLAEFFIRSLCPKGGTVLDPFSGSGTTAKVAQVSGRNAIAIDIRSSQVELTEKRTKSESAAVRYLF